MNAGLLAASMSGQSFSALPRDQWIEFKMNMGSKMKGGWIGITQNEEALHTNTKVVNIIAKVKESVTSLILAIEGTNIVNVHHHV